MSRAKCRACGEAFSSDYAFDKHRTGKYDINAPGFGRRCRTPEEMEERGMAVNSSGFWVSSLRTELPSFIGEK